MLQEDNYTLLADDSISCIDCSNNKSNAHSSKRADQVRGVSRSDSISKDDTTLQPHSHSLSPTLRSISSPCLLPDSSRPTLNPLHSSFSGLTGPRGLNLDSSPPSTPVESLAPRESEPTIKHKFTELDPNEQFSSSFYKSSLFYRRMLSPSSAATNNTSSHDYSFSSAPSLHVFRDRDQSFSPDASTPNNSAQNAGDRASNELSEPKETHAEEEDDNSSMFSSDFYRKSYYYRKSYSTNTLDNSETTTPASTTSSITTDSLNLNEPPDTLADKTIKRERRLSRKSRHSIEIRPVEPPPTSSDTSDPSESLFSESFYKKKHHSNKKFDFEFMDKSTPPPYEHSQATSEDKSPRKDTDKNNNTKALPEDPTYIAETLLDTTEDMKARGRVWASSYRRPPPSMGIRVSVPVPYFKKPEPIAIPPPAPSPSPPLSLPASPSPPPTSVSSSPFPLNTPPSSPQLPRKPHQGYGLQPNPPASVPLVSVSTPSPTLSRSTSPPLSLPAVANGKV